MLILIPRGMGRSVMHGKIERGIILRKLIKEPKGLISYGIGNIFI